MRAVGIQVQAVQRLLDALLPVPGVVGLDLRLQCIQVHALRTGQIELAHGDHLRQPGAGGGEHIRIHVQGRFLRHIRDAQVLLELQHAVVGLLQAPENLEEGRLARTVAADEADAFRGLKGEVRMIEQRDVTERQLGVEECDECHVGGIIRGDSDHGMTEGDRRQRCRADMTRKFFVRPSRFPSNPL
jgi:hypothetical protein